MNILRIRLFVHFLIFTIICLINFIVNFFFTTSDIPINHIGWLSVVYLVFYLLVVFLFEFIENSSKLKKMLAGVLYVTLLFCLVPLVELIIYRILPSFNIIFFDSNIRRNYNEFHYRIWKSFGWINMFALCYMLLLKVFKVVFKNKEISKQHEINRARATDIRYTSHFLKGVFTESFGEMLLAPNQAGKHINMDAIEFLGYVLEIEELGRMDDLNHSLDKVYCFIRLIKKHYGNDSITMEYQSDGTDIMDLPRGILIFPLENCIKHALISPDYPIEYSLIVSNSMLQVRCRSFIHRFKEKRTSGTGNNLLLEKLSYSNYTPEINTKSEYDIFDFNLKLIPNYVKKTKIQFTLFR